MSSSVRIKVVVSPELSPELYGELKHLPARARAERLRTLATLGGVLAQGGAVEVGVRHVQQEPHDKPEGRSDEPVRETNSEQDDMRRRLAGKLAASLG